MIRGLGLKRKIWRRSVGQASSSPDDACLRRAALSRGARRAFAIVLLEMAFMRKT